MKNTSEYSCDNCRCSISKEKHHTGKHLSKTKICITAAILLRLGGICISFIYLNYEIIQKLSSYIEVYQIKGLSHLASHSPTFHPTNSNPSEAWREDEMGYICIVLSDRCLPKRKPLNYFKDFFIRIIIRTTPAFFFFFQKYISWTHTSPFLTADWHATIQTQTGCKNHQESVPWKHD